MARFLSGLIGCLALTACGAGDEDQRLGGFRRVLSSCDDPSEWQGVTTTRSVEALEAISWDYGQQESIRLVEVDSDLSTHRAFRFRLDHPRPTSRLLELFVESENSATPQEDGFAASLSIDFKGRKWVTLHRDDMQRVGEPLGWDRVTGLRFSTRSTGPSDCEGGNLAIATLLLVDIAKQGIVLRDEELFDALDLDHEGLGPVRAAVADHDPERARKALADYLRNRTSVTWRFDHHVSDGKIEFDRDEADRVARGEVEVVGLRYAFPNGKIDWYYNRTRHVAEVPYNRQWENHLNRTRIWRPLGPAYWGTGDEKYAEAWVRQFRSWVRDCPYDPEPKVDYMGSQWRSLTCGSRMRNTWPNLYHYFLHSPSFTDDDIVLFVKSSLEHGRHLRRNHSGGAENHLAIEMEGLHTLGGLFPELKEAEDWRRYAIETLARAAEEMFYPDGLQTELSPSYHKLSLESSFRLVENSLRTGRLDELPRDYKARLEQACAAFVFLATPARTAPPLNDSGTPSVVDFLADKTAAFPRREDFLWMATDGAEGRAPDHTSHAFDWAGFCVMRSGWQRDASYLCFDAGPLGTGHAHQDLLNVVVWARGREVLFDSGGGSPESSRWRQFSTDTHSHNTVLVDGLGQRRPRVGEHARSTGPVDTRWETGPGHDFAAGVFTSGYGDSPLPYRKAKAKQHVEHTRRVLFVKPDVFVIGDHLHPVDEHEHCYQARWHLLTAASSRAETTNVVVTADERLANLAVVPILTSGLVVRVASGETDPELIGWSVARQGHDHVATDTVLHTRSGRGDQRFLTLLLPLAPGEADPVESVRVSGPASGQVRLRDGRVFVVEASPDPAGGLSFKETNPDGSPGRQVTAGE